MLGGQLWARKVCSAAWSSEVRCWERVPHACTALRGRHSPAWAKVLALRALPATNLLLVFAAPAVQALGRNELKQATRVPSLRRHSVQVCDVHRRLSFMDEEVRYFTMAAAEPEAGMGGGGAGRSWAELGQAGPAKLAGEVWRGGAVRRGAGW
jgi:hypothetical protein